MSTTNPFAGLADAAQGTAMASEKTQVPQPAAPADSSNPFSGLADAAQGGSKKADTSSALPVAAPALKDSDNPFSGLADRVQTSPDPSNDKTISHVDDVDEPWYSKTWDYLNKPLYDLHRNNAGAVEAGVEDVATSLTSPLSIGLTLATFGAGSALEGAGLTTLKAMGVAEKTAPTVLKGIKVLMDTGFTAQQVYGLTTQVPAVFDALKDGDYETAKRLGTSSLIGTTFAGLGAKNAIKDWGMLGEQTGILKPNETLKAVRKQFGEMQEAQSVNNAYTAEQIQKATERFDAVAGELSKKEKDVLLSAMNRYIGAGGDAQTLAYRRDAHLGTLPERPAAETEETPKTSADQKFLYTAVDPRGAEEAEKFGLKSRTFHADPQEAIDNYKANIGPNAVTVKINPKEFIDEVGDGGKVDSKLVESYRQQIAKDGWKYKGPKLELKYDAEGNITGGDGRHRALAAMKAGLKEIPVEVTRERSAPAVYGVPEHEVQAAAIDRGEIKPGEPVKSGGIHLPDHRAILDEQGQVTGNREPIGERAEGALDPDAVNREPATTELGKLTNEGFLNNYTQAERDRLIREYNTALNLTPEQKAFADDIAKTFNDNAELAYQHGMIREFIDHYITNTWKPEDHDNAALNQLRHQSNGGAFDTNVPYARHRIYQSDFEAEMLGRKKMISDPVKLMANYQHRLVDAIANRKFLEDIQDLGLRMPDKRAIVAIAGTGKRVGEESENPAVTINPRGMRSLMISQNLVDEMNHSGELKELLDAGKIKRLKDRMLGDPEAGPGEKKLTATYGWDNGDYQTIDHHSFRGWNYVTDDHAGAPVYMQGELKVHPEAVDFIRKIIGADRSGLRELPGYKVVSKASQEAKHLMLSLSPFHIAQEGLRALMTGINPFSTKFDINDEVLRQGIRNGLELKKDYRGLEEFTNEYKVNSAVINRIPGLRQAQGWVQQFLFDKYIPSLKSRAYKALVERYRNLGDLEPMRSAAAHTNELFGGLNYKMLGRSATTQDFFRLTTLAPDWLESEARLIGRTVGASGRAAQIIANQDNFRIAGYMFLAARVLNLLTNGKPHLEAPFGVVQEGKDGKDNTVYTMRTLPTDMLHAVSDPRAFMANRLNPLTVRTAMDLVSGRDEYGRKLPPQNAIFTAAKNIAPIVSQNPLQKLAGFPTDLNFWQQVAQGSGVSPYKYRTEAEKLAQDYASNKMPSGPENPIERAKYIRDIHLEDGIRNKTIAPVILRTMPDMSKRQADQLIKRSHMTPIQARFDRATLEEAINIYQVATPNEKEQLHTMLWKKRAAYLKEHTPKERAQDRVWVKLNQVYPDLRP